MVTLRSVALLCFSSPWWLSSHVSAKIEAGAYPYSIFRRDAYLDSSEYNEGLPQQNVGGRGHIVFQAQNPPNGGFEMPYSIQFQSGQTPIKVSPDTVLPSSLDWINVDWNPQSNWIWVSFHTPNDEIVSDINSLVVRDAGGSLMQSFKEVDFAHSGMELLYVSQVTDGDSGDLSIVVHFYCYYAGIDYEIDKLVLNGLSLPAGFTVHGLEHYVVTYNETQLNDAINAHHRSQRKRSISEVFNTGAPWTMNILLSDGLQFGWGGRFTLDSRRGLPIAAYPIDYQCPFPSCDTDNYNTLVNELSVNSVILRDDNTCYWTDYSVWSDYATNGANYGESSVLVTVDVASDNLKTLTDPNSGIDTEQLVLSTTGIATASLSAFDTTTSQSQFSSSLMTAWQTQLYYRQQYAYLASVVTSASNSRVGVFAGMTDVTIAQFFLGGCQYTAMDNTGSSFPATAVFDYVSNAVYNSMPQAVYAMINGPSLSENGASVLNAATLTVSIGSAFAAGAQGVILDQVDVNEQSSNNDAWNAAASLLKSYSALASQGSLNSPFGVGAGIVTSDDDGNSVWGALRSQTLSLVITAVNTDCSGYDPSQCSSSTTPQWICNSHSIQTVNVTLPFDFRYYYKSIVVYEMVNGKRTTIDFNSKLVDSNSILQFSGVNLDDEDTARIFYVGIEQ